METILDFTHDNLNYIQAINVNLFNSILTNVASRIGSQKLYDRFVEVLDAILEIEGITQFVYDNHKLNGMSNLNWQDQNIQAIEDFFEYSEIETSTIDTTTLGAGSLIASTILLTLCLFLRNIF